MQRGASGVSRWGVNTLIMPMVDTGIMMHVDVDHPDRRYCDRDHGHAALHDDVEDGVREKLDAIALVVS